MAAQHPARRRLNPATVTAQRHELMEIAGYSASMAATWTPPSRQLEEVLALFVCPSVPPPLACAWSH